MAAETCGGAQSGVAVARSRRRGHWVAACARGRAAFPGGCRFERFSASCRAGTEGPQAFSIGSRNVNGREGDEWSSILISHSRGRRFEHGSRGGGPDDGFPAPRDGGWEGASRRRCARARLDRESAVGCGRSLWWTNVALWYGLLSREVAGLGVIWLVLVRHVGVGSRGLSLVAISRGVGVCAKRDSFLIFSISRSEGVTPGALLRTRRETRGGWIAAWMCVRGLAWRSPVARFGLSAESIIFAMPRCERDAVRHIGSLSPLVVPM